MINSNDLTLVSLLSKGQSIAAAARELNLTPSAVSQRLTMLEEKTGVELAVRNGRSGIVLTSDGDFLAESAVGLLSELRAIQDKMNERKGVVSGKVVITASFGFGRHFIAPAVSELNAIYPNLSVNLNLTDDVARTPENSWDIVVRVSPKIDSSLKVNELGQNRRLLCASPKYVGKFGSPIHPENLKEHKCIAIYEDGDPGTYWNFTSAKEGNTTIKVKPEFITNDGDTALVWAINGLGIVMRSEWSALPAINAGQLIELLPLWSTPPAPIVAITNNKGAESLRIRSVMRHLSAYVKRNWTGK